MVEGTLKSRLFDFARRQGMSHDTLATCLSVHTGVKTSRSTVAAWSCGAREISPARAAVIKDKLRI